MSDLLITDEEYRLAKEQNKEAWESLFGWRVTQGIFVAVLCLSGSLAFHLHSSGWGFIAGVSVVGTLYAERRVGVHSAAVRASQSTMSLWGKRES